VGKKGLTITGGEGKAENDQSGDVPTKRPRRGGGAYKEQERRKVRKREKQQMSVSYAGIIP